MNICTRNRYYLLSVCYYSRAKAYESYTQGSGRSLRWGVVNVSVSLSPWRYAQTTSVFPLSALSKCIDLTKLVNRCSHRSCLYGKLKLQRYVPRFIDRIYYANWTLLSFSARFCEYYALLKFDISFPKHFASFSSSQESSYFRFASYSRLTQKYTPRRSSTTKIHVIVLLAFIWKLLTKTVAFYDRGSRILA